MANFTYEQTLLLAIQCAKDFMRSCTGPTIRGKNGEENLMGTSLKEVAEKNGLSVEEATLLTVDLSTTKPNDLPIYWQKTYVELAERLIHMINELHIIDLLDPLDILDKHITVLNFDNQKTRDTYGARIHEIWLKMPENSWAIGSELDKPFSQLPKAEQDKYIQQLKSCQEWYINIRFRQLHTNASA